MAIAIHALQLPSVGGCLPRLTTQGQNTVQLQLRNSSPLIAQSVGRIWRRLGFSTRLSMRWLTGSRSASGLFFTAMSFLPQTIAAARVTMPPAISNPPAGG
jgi:hypothetical protein